MKYMKYIVVIVISLVILSSEVNVIAGVTLKNMPKYCNGRYGFCLNYFHDFGIEPEPDNGDGRGFYNRDGFKMSVYGSNNVNDENVESLIKLHRNELDKITYKKVGNNWYVLSGYKGSAVKYIKVFAGKGSINHLIIEYPKDMKSEYDSLVNIIVKSFKPGDTSDQH